jgi:hypothetical protein
MLSVLLFSHSQAHAIEEASYEVLKKDDRLEVRQYDPQIVAEVTVGGSFDEAGDKAFRPLFRYISGDNLSRGKIAMTAPVSLSEQPQEIAMTAPVSQRQTGQSWAVSFMMVSIREIPSSLAAVVRYSGTWSKRNYQRHLDELMEWVTTNNYQVMDEPAWARYNAPFTPWFMRRNEIIVRIERVEVGRP